MMLERSLLPKNTNCKVFAIEKAECLRIQFVKLFFKSPKRPIEQFFSRLKVVKRSNKVSNHILVAKRYKAKRYNPCSLSEEKSDETSERNLYRTICLWTRT